MALLGLTGVVVLVTSRFEGPRVDDMPAPSLWKPVLAAVTVIAELAVMANVGVISGKPRDLVVTAAAGGGDGRVRCGAGGSRTGTPQPSRSDLIGAIRRRYSIA